MQNNGYLKCNVDHCCYFRKIGSNYIILLLYVYDMLVVDTYLDEINKLKKQQLSSEFEMKDLSVAKRILGMTNSKDKQMGTLWLYQAKYIRKVLQRFNMSYAKTIRIPLANHFKLCKEHYPRTDEEKDFIAKVSYTSAIGSLMYVMVCRRLDITYIVGVVSKFISNSGKQH